MFRFVSWGQTAGFVVAVTVILLVSGSLSGPSPHRAAAPSSGIAGHASPTACSALGRCPAGPRPATVVHDLVVTATDLRVFSGEPFAAYAVAPPSASIATIQWNFGDGSAATVALGTAASHTFDGPGLYLVFAEGVDGGGVTHDNGGSLLPVEAFTGHGSDALATLPDLSGTVVSNASSLSGATATTTPGGSVTLEVSLLSPARNVATTLGAASFVGSFGGHGSLHSTILNSTGTSRTTLAFDASTPSGLYDLVYSIPEATLENGTTLHTYANYTFTVAIGLAGSVVPTPAPPASRTLSVYEAGTAYSLDPAIDYDAPGQAFLREVYQTLVTYNGTEAGAAPSSFVPELATCVPGSSECSSLYGTSLVSSDGDNYTFVISSAAQFYDAATNQSWGVYPTDVVFSIARTLAFATIPCFGCNNGWMLAQALLSPGDPLLDYGSHAIVNNTPGPIFASMTVNGSACPSAAQTNDHGCVTFRADGGGSAWPFFLELLANPDGGSIVPCGWFSAPAQGAGIPDWTLGNVSGSGDQPCPMPGSSGYGVDPSTLAATAWDTYENNGGVGFSGVVSSGASGSGPYYLRSFTTSGYALAANPAYAANPACAGTGCEPAPGSYLPEVNVTAEIASLDPGVQALGRGTADLADAPLNTSSELPSLVDQGLASVREAPTLNINFLALSFDYDPSKAYNASGLTFSAPPTILADLNLRQFLLHSFSYATLQTTVFGGGGLQYEFPYGGAIPSFMGGYAPTNVSWPSGNADPSPSDVGSAAWWWARASGDLSGVCSAAAPCTLPVPYVAGDTVSLDTVAAWNQTVRSISGGAIAPVLFPQSFINIVLGGLYSGPGTTFALYPLGWATDFPDPTDTVPTLYAPYGSFGTPDSVGTVLSGAAYNAANCSTSLTYYASLAAPIPEYCQGAADAALGAAIAQAATLPLGPSRGLLYDEIEQVGERLGLYAATGQFNDVVGVAPWIDPATVVVTPAFGSAPWYEVRYRTEPSTPLAVRGPVATVDPVSTGNATSLEAQGTGGGGGYSYAWSGLPSSCPPADAATLICTPATSGNYTVHLTVTDAAHASASATLTLVVVGASTVFISGFAATPNPVTAGSTTVLAATAAGGATPYSYAYNGLPPGCSSADTAALACTPTAGGSYPIGVWVNDSLAHSAHASLTLVVTSPFAGGLTTSPSSGYVDIGEPVTIHATGSGGVLPIQVALTPFGSCATSFVWTTVRASNASCLAPLAAGVYSVDLTLTDAVDAVASATVTLYVNASPTIVSFGPARATDVGVPFSLTVAWSGGTGPFATSFADLPPGCAVASVASVACTPIVAGTFTAAVTVSDAYGFSVASTVQVIVNDPPSIAAFSATSTSLAVGASTNLTVSVRAGTGPFTYVYASLPPGCAPQNTDRLSCTPSAAGTYTANVTVTDGVGLSATANLTLTVTPSSTPATPNAGPSFPPAWLLVAAAVAAVAVVVVAVVLWRRRSRPAPLDPEAGSPPT